MSHTVAAEGGPLGYCFDQIRDAPLLPEIQYFPPDQAPVVAEGLLVGAIRHWHIGPNGQPAARSLDLRQPRRREVIVLRDETTNLDRPEPYRAATHPEAPVTVSLSRAIADNLLDKAYSSHQLEATALKKRTTRTHEKAR